ncbi:MAG: glutamate--tRNA ligase [Candidatus Kaiserbacteria bacterium]|nr:glutamate--tRNA ligase [Candidatus Kaiserbacteria bacterium]MCB9816058.1 glutamate--tRNA ligase [Candidatus Nomurabacteria bacterium]
MDHNTSKPVVTRFAPSPTGFLHIGGVRTALYAYLYARKHQGTFILRIEDTDKNREVEGSIQHIQDSLAWLGINWDYGPDKPGPFGSCLQSDRLDIYKKYAEKLVEKGLAYPDPYTAEETAAFREQAETEKRPFLMRHHRPDTFEAWDGTKPLRLKVPELKRYEWHDVVRGKLSAGEEMLDDIILIKADGYPTYNFAHIIDDLEMGVTHVMRGEEFIASTPKFLSIYDALEIPWPVFVTLPPIMGPDGKKKLSKRDGAKDLLDYKKDGYLPEAMCNFLALIGWNPGGDQELFYNTDELTAAFSLEKIHRSGGAFNEEKLKWMNKEHIKKLSAAEKSAYIKRTTIPTELSGVYAEARQEKLTETILERTHNIAEINEAAAAGEYDWLKSTPEYDGAILKWKNDPSIDEALPRLEKAAELLTQADFSTLDTVKEGVWSYAEETGKGEVLWPLRVALSGKERSPDPFTLAFILGQAETISRITEACDKIKA